VNEAEDTLLKLITGLICMIVNITFQWYTPLPETKLRRYKYYIRSIS